ncbi:hypothetical protein ASE73_09620 [Sphingomonas sp. Leaf24]|uniref:DUF2958 domain-containing protein n=1 Tax=unclassified Sphingomonas TaxID=196159 RepID=UPI0006FB0C0F|nr:MULTISPECIES: DUF2958 domain-containing protein [unclassified Sphingomonas]KQM17229.1 hypothetical protein ASE50_07670 [Sphingomonas sp. Leaf5]KQM88121.1 hypothetical protein ASE73_09620 [Sphingomonas sp. Leaf24]
MILLPPALRFQLRANAIARRAAQRDGRAEPDALPVLKLFNPIGAATWLATELDADDDTLFGLADLGFGCPELGPFSLREITSVRLPYGLGIERDLGFTTTHRLATWAAWARRSGSIILAETLLRRAATPPAIDPDPDNPDPDPAA